MFECLIRGQNEYVTPNTGGKLNNVKRCRWCRLVQSGEHVVVDEPAFVVFEGPARRGGGYLTLVTRAHASVITELPLGDMGAVLAGLTRVSDRLTGTAGAAEVHIYAHPVGRPRRPGHLHFRLVSDRSSNGKRSAHREAGLSAFPSLAETISH